MRFTVVGAGAIGATVGAHLVRAGHTVKFVDSNERHVRAMRKHGLEIRGYGGTFTIAVDAETPRARFEGLGTVLLCVKSQHTAQASQWLAPFLASADAVVSLQNGLCEPVIAQYVGDNRVIGALVNFSADLIAPGIIHFAGPGAFYVGELDGSATHQWVNWWMHSSALEMSALPLTFPGISGRNWRMLACCSPPHLWTNQLPT